MILQRVIWFRDLAALRKMLRNRPIITGTLQLLASSAPGDGGRLCCFGQSLDGESPRGWTTPVAPTTAPVFSLEKAGNSTHLSMKPTW